MFLYHTAQSKAIAWYQDFCKDFQTGLGVRSFFSLYLLSWRSKFRTFLRSSPTPPPLTSASFCIQSHVAGSKLTWPVLAALGCFLFLPSSILTAPLFSLGKVGILSIASLSPTIPMAGLLSWSTASLTLLLTFTDPQPKPEASGESSATTNVSTFCISPSWPGPMFCQFSPKDVFIYLTC